MAVITGQHTAGRRRWGGLPQGLIHFVLFLKDFLYFCKLWTFADISLLFLSGTILVLFSAGRATLCLLLEGVNLPLIKNICSLILTWFPIFWYVGPWKLTLLVFQKRQHWLGPIYAPDSVSGNGCRGCFWGDSLLLLFHSCLKATGAISVWERTRKMNSTQLYKPSIPSLESKQQKHLNSS